MNESALASVAIEVKSGGADESAGSADAISGEARRRLVAQFEQWLDRMSAGEPPPQGLPPELLAEALGDTAAPAAGESDLFTLFSALTTLSGEIRLQGRAFKQLADAVVPLAQLPGRFDRLAESQAQIADEIARSAAEQEESDLPPAKDILGVLFDLYARLQRGLRMFDSSTELLQREASRGGWRQRLLGGKALAGRMRESAGAIREGYQLTLSRLEGAFQQWGIQRAGAVGEMFDPETMNVIEVQSVPDRPDGTVLEVLRSGYLLHGTLLVTAQVKVSRNDPARQSS